MANKTEVAAVLREDLASQGLELNKGESEMVVQATLDAIKTKLVAGEEVKFAKYGTFSVTERSARKGRNPQTGEEIEIAASKGVKFKALPGLKDSVQ